MPKTRRFHLCLIKPSHYDDEGYVIQWFRSPIPANSLAALYGLACDCRDRGLIGTDWDLDISAIDETNTRVRIDAIADEILAADAGMVMLVGVQSNQFPRALDIARPLRARGISVAMGGFHVSGVMAMIGKDAYGLDVAKQMGVTLYAGEAEDWLASVLRDAVEGRLQAVYDHMADLPGLTNAPVPFMPAGHVARTAYNLTSFDAGRGCPYQCSFCTIINVQGRKSRRRSPEDVEKIVRDNLAQGVHRFFITDDNFARNKDWEALVDRLIAMREGEGLNFNFFIQVDTLCHMIPHFIEKCARAGVKRVFIGLENINPANLAEAKKKQNRINEYRQMLLAWKEHRVITYAGYIIGFAADTHDSVMRDIDLIKRELPIDILEFFYLTPLPGSEDHQKLHRAGSFMEEDLNAYDLNHLTTHHGTMTDADWRRTYRDAWGWYYTPEHVETILRRAAASGLSTSNILLLLVWFLGALRIEGVHPLECGVLRRKQRRDRRPGRRIVPALVFYPMYGLESAAKWTRWLTLYLRYGLIMRRVDKSADKSTYSDRALSPVTDREEERDLFGSAEAQAFLASRHRIEALTAKVQGNADPAG